MAGAATGAPQRGLSSSSPLPREVVAVLCPDSHPALQGLPRSMAEFVIGSDVASLDPNLLPLARALVIFPFSPACVDSAAELLRGGQAPKIEWVHCYTAGVDSLSSFIAGPLKEAHLPLTNGRSAFSSSLAEYALLAALYFNKKVPRCQANRAARVWDKFQMPVLRGQTMGLLGYGDIGKHTARLGKAFGMRVIALRRNADKKDEEGLLDLTIGPYEGPILPAHKVSAT
jgi:sodium/hydrogen exchanger 8